MKSVLARLTAGLDLDPDQMEAAVGNIMDGTVTDAQIGAFLAALKMKGETVTTDVEPDEAKKEND